jgi:hypothetical protein
MRNVLLLLFQDFEETLSPLGRLFLLRSNTSSEGRKRINEGANLWGGDIRSGGLQGPMAMHALLMVFACDCEL